MEEDNKQFYYDPTPTRDIDGYIHVDPVTGESKAVSSELNQNGKRTVLGNNASFNLGEATGTGWNKIDRERLRRAFHMNLDDPETVRRIRTYHTNEDGSINWHSFNFNPWIADNFVSVTNPEGMARIRNAVKSGGDLAGYLEAAVLAAPLVLEAAPLLAFNRLGQSAVGQTAKVMFDPYTIPGAITNSALTAPFAVDMMNNGVNAENAVGAGLGALPYAGPVIVRGYNIGKNLYISGKDLIWLTKAYNKVGTGLTNPYVRDRFLDLAKHPSISRNFIETYSRSGEAGLNYSQIEEALPQLKKLQEEFNITPQMNFKDFEPVAEQVEGLRNALQSTKDLNYRYTKELEYLKGKNKVLYNIAKESPQYQQQIVNDLKNGNITNVEEYVKNLIKQSNTFLRRMNLQPGQDFTEAFSKIRGSSIGQKDFSMDVGNPEVVFDPIWSRGYGNNVAIYSPKEIKLNGPVETWWSQRKPTFQDKSIYINTEGLHTGNAELYPADISYNVHKYIKSVGLPNSYGRTASHMIFLSPNKGASIADWFTVTPGNPNIRYTLGYKNGNKIEK